MMMSLGFVTVHVWVGETEEEEEDKAMVQLAMVCADMEFESEFLVANYGAR